MWVLKTADQERFTFKASPSTFCIEGVLADELDRDRLPKFVVFSEPDLTHSSFTQERQQSVPFSDDRTFSRVIDIA